MRLGGDLSLLIEVSLIPELLASFQVQGIDG